MALLGITGSEHLKYAQALSDPPWCLELWEVGWVLLLSWERMSSGGGLLPWGCGVHQQSASLAASL